MSRSYARVTVTLSPALLARLEAFSKCAQTSTSAVVEFALERQLDGVQGEAFLQALSASGLSRRRSVLKKYDAQALDGSPA
jgi:hypothetical protein